MRTVDFAPLYRSAIGFDRLASLFDAALQGESQSNYPPYNVELVSEDKYRIVMALAGFSQSELDLVVENDTLKVSGRKPRDEAPRNFLHRGIATRDFEQRFELADHVKVMGARFENGLLTIELQREVPEAMKPRRVQINADDTVDMIGERKAA